MGYVMQNSVEHEMERKLNFTSKRSMLNIKVSKDKLQRNINWPKGGPRKTFKSETT